jgi:capsular polysaccharide transport system permease protein
MSVEPRNVDQANKSVVPAKKPNIVVLDNLLRVDVRPGRVNEEKRKEEIHLITRFVTKKVRLRHLVISASFALLVAVPTIFSGLYMALVAADQYHSSSAFAVRNIDGQVSSDLLGMFTQGSGGGSTSADSYMLLDYIRSERMIDAVNKEVDLEAAFARRGADFFYGMASALPIEKRVEYWRNMVQVDYEATSSIVNLTVKAFDPESAQKIASTIISESERLINDLSFEARNGVMKSSQEEVERAEGRLSSARIALRNFRDISQEADPVEAAKLAGLLVGSLEQELTKLRAELTAARTRMSSDSPRIRVINTQITSLEKQLEQEKQRFGSGSAGSERSTDVASKILQYESLETEREFAEKAYTAALGGLEKARIDANNQQSYLATFIRPTLSELAQYPTRILNVFFVFLGCLFVWGVMVMGYYNIRDRN